MSCIQDECSWGRKHTMTYAYRPSRPQSGGFVQPSSRSRSFPPRSKIHPSQYIQKAVEIIEPSLSRSQTASSFEQLEIMPVLVENLTRRGITEPTPIQQQIIPLLLQKRDVIGIANTGTGKTLAFLLPLMQKIWTGQIHRVLIVAPTRELAVQIRQDVRELTTPLRLSNALCIGGANMRQQMQELRSNPPIVIGTPGRLKDFIQQRMLNPHHFDAIVLDEVDRMLYIGFRKEIEELLAQLPEKHLSAFFSATVDAESESIMMRHSSNPMKIVLAANQTNTHIEQDVVKVSSMNEKIQMLHSFLSKPEFSKVIVFGRTKHGINRLEEQLAQRGLRVCSIHGNKTQNARQKSLRLFTQGHTTALLATDIAARGIDIDNVSHVINFDEPQTYQDYIHRIGRTGRAGQSGKALTFIVQSR